MNQPLSDEEKRFYGQIFKTLDPNSTGLISGLAAKPLLEASGLPLPILGEIWNLADPENVGSLNQFGFCVAMRLICHAQNGASNLSSELAQNLPSPVSLAHFNSLSSTPQSPTPLSSQHTQQPQQFQIPSDNRIASTSSVKYVPSPTAASPAQLTKATLGSHQPLMAHSTLTQNTTGGNILPPLSPQAAQSFGQMFDRTTTTGVLSGLEAKDIFMKSRLPNQLLISIWNIVDRNRSGNLDRSEFIIAMHLIQCVLNKSLSMVPAVLPDALWKTASGQPSSSISPRPSELNSRQSSYTTNPPIQSLPPQQAGSPLAHKALPLAPPSTAPSLPPAPPSGLNSNDLVMTPQQKQQFGVIFDNMDKSLKGSLTSAEVAQYLMTSQLPNDVLASIWELANLDGSDDFTKQEFSIAMFYVQRQLSGFPLPEETPLSLITSSRFDQEQHQHHESIPLPQARQYDAPPQQPPTAPKARTKTHLDDLVDLSFVPAPSAQPSQQRTHQAPPAPAPRASQQAPHAFPQQTPTYTGSAFVPKSQFGQQMVQEQNIVNDEVEEPAEIVKAAPPAIPGRDHKPTFTGGSFSEIPSIAPSPSPVQKQPSSAPNYDALRSFSEQPSFQASQTSQQFSQQPNVQQKQADFSSPSMGGFTSAVNSGANTLGSGAAAAIGATAGLAAGAIGGLAFSSAPNASSTGSGSTGTSDRDIKNQFSKATVDIANYSNQVSSLTVQTSNISEKRAKSQAELSKILKVKEDIQNKITQLKSLHESESTKVNELQRSLISAKQENESLSQEVSVAEANYHAEQTKSQQLQLQLEETQKESQQMKERLSVLNTDNDSLKGEIEELTNKLKQSHNFLAVSQQQVSVAEEENRDLTARVSEISKNISEIENRIQLFFAKKSELEKQNDELDDKYGELANHYGEKSLAYTTALAEGGHTGALAAAAIAKEGGEFAQTGLGETHAAENDDDDEVPTAELDEDFDEDFMTSSAPVSKEIKPASEKETVAAEPLSSGFSGSATQETLTLTPAVINAPSETQSTSAGSFTTSNGIDSSVGKQVTETDASSPSNSDFNFSQGANTQSFSLPLGRPQSVTSSVQNNPPQSVRGDLDVSMPQSPTSTIAEEEAAAAASQEMLSSQVLPEGSTDENVGITENQTAYYQQEDKDIAPPISNLGDIPTSSGGESFEMVSKNDAEILTPTEEQQLDNATVTQEAPSTTEDSTEEVPSTSEDLTAEVPGSFSSATVDETSVPKSTPIDEEFPPIQELDIDDDDSSEEEEDVETDQQQKEYIPEGSEVEESEPVVETSEKSEKEEKEVLESEEKPIADITKESPALTVSDDDEFHDTVQEVGDSTDVPEFTSAPASAPVPEFTESAPVTATTIPSFNPFTTQTNAPVTANVQTKGTDLFDDLDLEEAQVEEGDGAAPHFSDFGDNFGSTGFFGSNEQTSTDGKSGNDDWEQVFAGFGNDPQNLASQPTRSEAPVVNQIASFSGSLSEDAGLSFTNTDNNVLETAKQTVNESTLPQAHKLAIEELQSMGFAKEEAIDALNKHNWSIDDATNYLLDAS